MLNNVIDPITGLPRKLGELYNDRNIRLVGEMRWDAAANRVDTRNLRVISTPSDGGSPAITVIPDGSYTLSTGNTSIWVQLRRTAGTTTVVPGTSLVADVSTQDKPRQDWIQLFLRTSTGDIVTLGNWVVLAAPQWTKAGVTRGTSIYDAIVGSATNPFSTHTTIQGAIDDALDGDRILVLSGQYSISGPGNTVLDSSAALSWSGKTLTLEGEGYTTVVQNTGSLARAFSIFSTNSSSNASFGSGSRVLNMHLKNYPQTVRLNGGTEFGVRHCGFDFYSTAVSSYVAPDKTGTGTFAANVVKEQTLVGSTFAARQTIVGAEIVTDVQTESSAVLSSSGSRVISVQNALRIGDTNAPTQALDVVGSLRTTVGSLITPNDYLTVLDDAGSTQDLRAKTLVLTTNTSATSQQTLDVDGGIRTVAGRIHSSSSFVGIYNDSSSSMPVKVGSLVVSNNYSDAASSQSCLVRGSIQVDGSTILGTNISQSISLKSPATGYGIIPLGAVIATIPALSGAYNCTATTQPDSNGFVQCNGGTIVDPGGPMHGVVVPNINNNYFIMGATTNIGALKPEESTFTNPTYSIPAHTHSFSLSADNTGVVNTDSKLGDHGHTVDSHSHTVNDHSHHLNDHTHEYDKGNNSRLSAGNVQTTASGVDLTVPSGKVELGVLCNDTNERAYNASSGSLYVITNSGGPSASSTKGSSPGTNSQSPGTDDVNLAHTHNFQHGHSVSGSVGKVGTTNVDTSTVSATKVTNGSISNFRPNYISAKYIMRVR